MYATIHIDFDDFYREFERRGEGQRFTPEGFAALFDHLEQEEKRQGEYFEMDATSLCYLYRETDSPTEDDVIITRLDNGNFLCET